jgi:hypothetical protein
MNTETYWKDGLKFKSLYTNTLFDEDKRKEFALKCILNFENYIVCLNKDKKIDPNDKQTQDALTFASKAYEYLGNEEQAKEYLNLLNQDIPIKEDSTKNTSEFSFKFNSNQNKRMFIVDNFYDNPDEIRNFALNQEYIEDLRWYKGLRSKVMFRPPGLKERFEEIINEKINVFEDHYYNGCFQLCKSNDLQVYHCDVQKWAAMIYLTPNAPLESGTRLHRSKINGCRHGSEPNIDNSFSGDFYDSTKFDIVDGAGNIYNRLVIMDAQCIHSAGPYFGSTIETCRLTHLFFFD